MHLFQLFTFAAIFAQSALSMSHGSQYCYSSKSEPSSFCVSFAQARNYTSQGTDLYLAFSALPTQLGGGWSSIGIGNVMAGALMFILWADEERENIALSVRTASAHTEPFSTDNLPQVRILEAKASKEASHEVTLVCYSCDKWSSLDFQKRSQPWIWASNYFATFKTTDPDQYIGSHQLHDVFYVDMTAVPSNKLSDGNPVLPKVQGLTNIGTWDRLSSPSKSPRLGSGFWHGIFTLIAFMGIMMPSAIYKRWKPNTRYHMLFQLLASGLAIVGVGFGLVCFKSSGSSIGPHQILGFIASWSIIMQIFFGAQILSLQQTKNSWSYRALHRWLGRCALFLGISDSGLGLALVGTDPTGLIVWCLLAFSEFVLYWMLEPGAGKESGWHEVFSFGRGRYVVKVGPMNDEDTDLTDLVEDEESGNQLSSKPL